MSRNAAGEPANEDVEQVVVDGDGSLVAYLTEASNLVGDDTNGVADVFLFSVGVGTTRLITRDPAGEVVELESHGVDISDDGDILTIGSYAPNLVPDDSNDSSDVFTYDRISDDWTLISRGEQGLSGEGNSYQPVISPDGGYVAFTSNASLLDEDGTFLEDVYLYYRTSDRLELVSRSLDGGGAAAESYAESISRHGRAVTFSSEADDLVEGDTNDDTDVFLFYQRRREAIFLVSKTKDGAAGDLGSYGSAVDAKAKAVVFGSAATNLVRHDDNEESDIFRHRRPTE